MKAVTRACATVVLLAGGLAVAPPIAAHHSFASYDMERNVTYKGVVREFHWVNPHFHIIVEIPQGPGVDPATVGVWDFEGGAPTVSGRQGWTRNTVKPGDSITVVGHPLKNGDKGASLFFAIAADGRCLYHDIARPLPGGPGCNEAR